MNRDKNLTPLTLARETLQKLSSQKIPPTPDNYHRVYNQIAGKSEDIISEDTSRILKELMSILFSQPTPNLFEYTAVLEQAIETKDWSKYKAAFVKFVETEVALKSKLSESTNAHGVIVSWARVIETLFKQLETGHGALTIAKKRAALNRVLAKFSQDPNQLYSKLEALIDSWQKCSIPTQDQIDSLEEFSSSAPPHNLPPQDRDAINNETDNLQLPSHYIDRLLKVQAQMLESIVGSWIDDNALSNEAKLLAKKLRMVRNEQEIRQCVSSLEQIYSKFDLQGENGIKLQQGLLRLLNLLINSTGYLLSEDQWVNNKITMLQESISKPLDLQNIVQAEHYLEEIIQRQEEIKQRLSEAKLIMKQMVTSLISNIEELSDSTGEYHDKLGYYSEKINQTDDIEVLNQFVVEIMAETKQMQKSALNYRNDFLAARAEVSLAQNKINQLEAELLEMGEKVHEDHLTGILNRRGLDEAFERETSRSTRHQAPLCFALLDIDNFKQLNDTHGHKVGDDALVYLVESIKETTRPEDIVSRYGGEEFVILLPNTELEEAVQILSRVRRNLTKKFFLHDNNRLLITFSAGVAQLQPGEVQESIFKRADEALYRAKKAGKNQVLTSE